MGVATLMSNNLVLTKRSKLRKEKNRKEKWIRPKIENYEINLGTAS